MLLVKEQWGSSSAATSMRSRSSSLSSKYPPTDPGVGIGRRSAPTSGSRRNYLGLSQRGGGASEPPLAGADTALAPLAIPDEGGRGGVPARHRVLQPADQFRRALRVLPRQGPADHDPLQGLRHIQPGAAQRRVQRHDPVLE